MPTPPADGLIQIDQVFEELLMKMEVLSVQNQFQGQFGVIGSTKAKDWTSPLTPPPPPPPTTRKRSGSSSQQQRAAQQQQQLQHSSSSNNTQRGDVVDGRQPQPIQHVNHQQQQPLKPKQHHHLYHNQHTTHPHPHPYRQQQQQQLSRAMEAATPAGSRYAYNNNLLCCEPPSPLEGIGIGNGDGDLSDISASSDAHFGAANDDVDAAAVNELSQRLQAELRAAKSRHLACTEVSLPWDLTPRIAAEIIKTSEREPCGVRGCTIFIEFEDEPNNTRRIASFNVDPHTVPTFELYLTLKHDKSGWTSLLPQFLKNLTRSSTILISPNFTLIKNKLYSCE